MLNPCSLPFFLSAIGTLGLPEHSSFHGFTALPQKQCDLSGCFSCLGLSGDLSEWEQDPWQPLFCPLRGELLKPISELSQPFLFDTSVAGEFWGSEAPLLGKPSVQF